MFATALIQTLMLIPPLSAVAFSQPLPSLAFMVPKTAALKDRLIVSSTPKMPVNGSPVLFQVRTPEILRSLTADFLGRQLFFDFDASTGNWYSLGGVSIETRPGLHPMTFQATLADGSAFTFEHSATIGRKKYRTIALSVPRQFTEPDEVTQERIKAERELKNDIFSRISPQRWWTGSFIAPILTPMTDPYGTQRTFNGKVQSAHLGQDFRASLGMPVAAMNKGMVILARDMFYEGGLIVLDHGQGLLSLYMHLSKIDVREGELVNKKQHIAFSGGSGRATGPHLHVGIRWQGVYVDPAPLFLLQLP